MVSGKSWIAAAALGSAAFLAAYAGHASAQNTPWNSAVVERSPDWYASAAARAVADGVLQYPSAAGGWQKNTDLSVFPPRPDDIAPDNGRMNTFDNDGTTLPMEYLARVFSASGGNEYRSAFLKGVDYILAAQYPNGGWPQFYPLRQGYYSHITFNDDAMTRVLTLLDDVAHARSPYAFVDPTRRARAREAVQRGIELILRAQIRHGDTLTGWCAQYEVESLEPAWARAYEPPSLSGAESVGILRFLMRIESPSPSIIASIEGGVVWLRAVAISGQRYETFINADGQSDRRVVPDPDAPPIWARFYELQTNRPIFLGRDSSVRYALAEIERERRVGYHYYGDWAHALLERDYPAWRARLSR